MTTQLYDEANVFLKIINGELDCDKVYEDDFLIAFKDIAPVAPIHVLLLPKEKFRSFHDFVMGSKHVAHFFRTISKLAAECGLVDSGYRVVMNHNNDAGQIVYHFHAHLIGGKKLGGIA